MYLTITIDQSLTEFKDKPTNINYVSYNLNTNPDESNQEIVSLDTLLDIIGNGITFVPSHYKGKRNSNNFTKTNFVCFDIDDPDQTPEETISKLQEMGLTTNAWYHTFGYVPGENHKHRAIVYFDDYITDIATFKGIVGAGIALLNADKSCSDPCRIFFSTNGVEKTTLITDKPNSYKDFIQSSVFAKYLTISKNTSSRAKLGKKIFSNHNTSQYLTDLENRVDSAYPATASKSIDSMYLRLCDIPLFNDFLIEDKKLKHHDLMIVASTLRFLPRGLKYFRDRLKLHDYTQSEKDLYWICEKYNYAPMNVNVEGITSPVEYILLPSSFTVTDHTPYPFISLTDAESKLQSAFKHTLTNDKTLSIIDAECGLGKTRMLVEYVVNKKFNRKNGIAIAFPTHTLKSAFYYEVQAHLAKIGSTLDVDDLVAVTPELPKFRDKKINEGISKAYEMHDARQISYSLKNPAEGLKKYTTEKLSDHDIDLATKFCETLERVLKETNKVLLTTHVRAARDTMTHYTVIFDEDPIAAIESVTSIHGNMITCLDKIIHDLPNSEIKDRIRKQYDHQYGSIKERIINENVISRDDLFKAGFIGYYVNFADIFLNAKYVVYSSYSGNFLCATPATLNENKKYIITSATPALLYYENNYDIDYTLVNRTKHVGITRQIADQSYSRTQCEKEIKKIKTMANRPDRSMITFKGTTEELGNYTENEDIYFGNTSGHNTLEGKDTAVLGTPHIPPDVIYISALIAGYDIKQDEAKFVKKRVKSDGQTVLMSSFNNEILQKIQMHHITQNILQAHGRSRTIREKAKVDLYTNCPLPKYISREVELEGKRIASF